MKEKLAETRIMDWFREHKFTVQKGVSVDIEARLGKRKLHLVEVKGDHVSMKGKGRNYGALRNGFLMGLGQILAARHRYRDATLCLGLTEVYRDFVLKYSDVLMAHRISVVWVSSNSISKQTQLRKDFRKLGHGHPNGIFACGRARFKVAKGSLAWVKIDGCRNYEITKFAQLCRALDISANTDAASRALYRYSYCVRQGA